METFHCGFNNRQQLAAYVELGPTTWQSGLVDREQCVSQARNLRFRTTLIQLAWLWLTISRNRRWRSWLNQPFGFT
jgi:transposase